MGAALCDADSVIFGLGTTIDVAAAVAVDPAGAEVEVEVALGAVDRPIGLKTGEEAVSAAAVEGEMAVEASAVAGAAEVAATTEAAEAASARTTSQAGTFARSAGTTTP